MRISFINNIIRVEFTRDCSSRFNNTNHQDIIAGKLPVDLIIASRLPLLPFCKGLVEELRQKDSTTMQPRNLLLENLKELTDNFL